MEKNEAERKRETVKREGRDEERKGERETARVMERTEQGEETKWGNEENEKKGKRESEREKGKR